MFFPHLVKIDLLDGHQYAVEIRSGRVGVILFG